MTGVVVVIVVVVFVLRCGCEDMAALREEFMHAGESVSTGGGAHSGRVGAEETKGGEDSGAMSDWYMKEGIDVVKRTSVVSGQPNSAGRCRAMAAARAASHLNCDSPFLP